MKGQCDSRRREKVMPGGQEGATVKGRKYLRGLRGTRLRVPAVGFGAREEECARCAT